MSWTFNSNKIIVTAIPKSMKQIIAKLQPLNGGTIYQTFGYEKPVVKLKGYVVGDTVMANLEALYITGSSYALMEGATNHGSFYINNLEEDRMNWICQTIDPTQATDAHVYSVDIELYKT